MYKCIPASSSFIIPNFTHFSLYIYFFCLLISRRAFILWVTEIVRKMEIWECCVLRRRMWIVPTINRQTLALNQTMTNMRTVFTNTTLVGISSKHNSVRFTTGFLERICAVTRGLPVVDSLDADDESLPSSVLKVLKVDLFLGLKRPRLCGVGPRRSWALLTSKSRPFEI